MEGLEMKKLTKDEMVKLIEFRMKDCKEGSESWNELKALLFILSVNYK